jgi:transcription initiation factor TFIIIB Brf1 subunit/transcription initiation factor TFIIB
MISLENSYDPNEHFIRIGDKTDLQTQLECDFQNHNYHEVITNLKERYDHISDQDHALSGIAGYLSELDCCNDAEDYNRPANDTVTGLYFSYRSKEIRPDNDTEYNDNSQYNCHLCGSIDSVKAIQGIAVCVSCGVEMGPIVSDELECQYAGVAVGDNANTARSGLSNNNLLPGSNLSTKIVGNQISYSMKQINNVWDSLNYRERTLLKIFKHISDNCRSKGIPKNVIDYSQVLFTMAYEKQKKLKKGNRGSRSDKLEGMIGGCIYYSCKGYNINRSHQEIAEICGVDKSVISYGCKLVFRLLHSELDLNMNRTTYNDFLERYAYHLNLEENELEIIKECCNEIYQHQFLDNSKPSTLVAVTIYLCSNLYDFGLDKFDIAEQCHTTEPTLNKNYKILMEHIDQIIV